MKRWIQLVSSRTVWVSLAGIAGVVCVDVFELNVEQGTIDKAVLSVGAIILWLLVGDVKGIVANLKGKK